MHVGTESFAFLLIMRSGKRSCGRPAFVTIVSVLLTAIIVPAVSALTTGQSKNKEAAVGKDGYSISGRLLDKPGGKGVRGVIVGGPWGTGSARAADDGVYSFTGMAPLGFSYWLAPEQRPGVWTDWVMVDVIDSDVTDRDLYVTLPQSISGTARDAKTGNPIAGALIMVNTHDGNRDGIRTDAQGNYLLYVRPREVTFFCEGKDGYCVLDDNGKETDGLGKTVTVGPGERIKGIDFELKWSPIFWGHVVYPDGRPACGVRIESWVHWDNRGGRGGGFSVPPGGGRRFWTTTDGQGRFGGGMLVNGRIPGGLRPSTVKEAVSGALHEDTGKEMLETFRERLKEEGTVLTDLNGSAALPDESMGTCFNGKASSKTHRFKPFKIVLEKSGQVTLEVIDPNGKPLNGAWVDAQRPIEYGWIPGYWKWNIGGAECVGDGRYLMRKLVPGMSYHLNVHTPAGIAESEGFVLKPGESRDVNTVTVRWTKKDAIVGLVKQTRTGNDDAGAYERKIAAYLLGQMGSQAKAAVPELVAQLKIDLIADTRCRIVEALGRIGDARALEALREALKDENEQVRKAAAEAIQRIEQAQKSGTKTGSRDGQEAKKEVSGHRWQRERVENIAGESIEQTIENLANFDDCHFASTSFMGGRHGGILSSEVIYVVNLFRVRRLLEEGRANRGVVIAALKSAYKEALAGWPQARTEVVAYIHRELDAGRQASFSQPCTADKLEHKALAATYLLAELQDHDSLPLLVHGYRVHSKWRDELEKAGWHALAVPIPFTLYAIHRLASTLEPAQMSEEALAARAAYLEWAGRNLALPVERVVSALHADYDESDVYLRIVDPRGQVLTDQPKISLARYPCLYSDGAHMQIPKGLGTYTCPREKEWAGLLLPFVEAAQAKEQPAKNAEALNSAPASKDR